MNGFDSGVRITTGCKVNLFLNICSLREDGFHELETLFYPLPEPADELFIQKSANSGLRLICPERPSLANETTTLHKALAVYNEASGLDRGFDLVLTKRVPCGAGLGGGSANAAGFLRYLNDTAGAKALPEDRLLFIAAKVGADVPFFLLNSPALATGIGEKLKPVNVSLAGKYFLLIYPDIHVSTPWAYREWDKYYLSKKQPHNFLHVYFYSNLTSSELTDKTPFPYWPWFYNNLENIVFPAYPEIAAIKEELLRAGARSALMSGSGSTVFGIFDSFELAEQAVDLPCFAPFKRILQHL